MACTAAALQFRLTCLRLAMLMIERCGVTAERQHVDCWSVARHCANRSIIKGVHEPVAATAASSFVSNTACTAMLMMHWLWRHSREAC
jgi:hypothetical protein